MSVQDGLRSDQLTTDHGLNFFLPGAGDYYDFQAETIEIHFGPQSGGQGGMIFSMLDWGDVDGELIGVTFNVTSGQLSSDVQISNLTTTGFQASLDCTAINNCSVTGVTYQLLLEVEHGPPPTDLPEPSALLLFGVGLAGLGWMARRRRA